MRKFYVFVAAVILILLTVIALGIFKTQNSGEIIKSVTQTEKKT